MTMRDLNDYALFADIVANGGLAPAGRALCIPKSTLSRRLSALEARLGARLIERSTRQFRVTEVGQAFYERCRTILLDLEQADAVVANALGEPRGFVRCSCPIGLIEVFAPTFSDFMLRYPQVILHIVVANQPVDLISERIDLAIRVRAELTTDAALTMRTLGNSRHVLVTGPSLAETCAGRDIAALASIATLSADSRTGEISWDLCTEDGRTVTIKHEPRLICGDFRALRHAAAAGVGVALLPDHTCRGDLASGRLVRVFPQWATQLGIVHLVFTTRRGLPPAVRALIECLAVAFRHKGLVAPPSGE
jgi:DNA-binding transcriptional LysR family regulator